MLKLREKHRYLISEFVLCCLEEGRTLLSLTPEMFNTATGKEVTPRDFFLTLKCIQYNLNSKIQLSPLQWVSYRYLMGIPSVDRVAEGDSTRLIGSALTKGMLPEQLSYRKVVGNPKYGAVHSHAFEVAYNQIKNEILGRYPQDMVDVFKQEIETMSEEYAQKLSRPSDEGVQDVDRETPSLCLEVPEEDLEGREMTQEECESQWSPDSDPPDDNLEQIIWTEEPKQNITAEVRIGGVGSQEPLKGDTMEGTRDSKGKLFQKLYKENSTYTYLQMVDRGYTGSKSTYNTHKRLAEGRIPQVTQKVTVKGKGFSNAVKDSSFRVIHTEKMAITKDTYDVVTMVLAAISKETGTTYSLSQEMFPDAALVLRKAVPA
jgi:hypothetical protein